MAKVIQVHVFLKTGAKLSGPEMSCEDISQAKSNMSDMLASSATLRLTAGKTGIHHQLNVGRVFHHVIPVSSIDYVTIEEK